MDYDVFINHKLATFFGVLVLYFSVSGVLGHIPKDLVRNTSFLVIFILGIILGGMLIERGISPYFINNLTAQKSVDKKKRR